MASRRPSVSCHAAALGLAASSGVGRNDGGAHVAGEVQHGGQVLRRRVKRLVAQRAIHRRMNLAEGEPGQQAAQPASRGLVRRRRINALPLARNAGAGMEPNAVKAGRANPIELRFDVENGPNAPGHHPYAPHFAILTSGVYVFPAVSS